MRNIELEKTLAETIATAHPWQELRRRLREGCLQHAIDYDLGPNRRVPIDLMGAPTVLSQAELDLLYRTSEVINHYMRKLPALWMHDPLVRATLPFPQAEQTFFTDCYRDGQVETLVSRNDFDLVHPNHAVVFEPNGCSIGGIYYAAACARVMDAHVLADTPTLAPLRGSLSPLPDACALIASLFFAHAEAIGARRPKSVGLLENREWTIGITEMPSLARMLATCGLRAVVGDPRELRVRGGRFHLAGEPVDLLYRNMELGDFVALEQLGHKLDAVREAFRRNIVISSLCGDFDHKSAWEVLTSKATRHVVAREHRALLSKHLLWTRLVREGECGGPDGETIDLLPYAARRRSSLVLKPNRACGGEDVFIGPELDDARWHKLLVRATKKQQAGRWVLQSFHKNGKRGFPPASRLARKSSRYYVTYGVISTPFGQAVLGRASGEAVVNVSRGGGFVALFGEKTRGRKKSKGSALHGP